MLESEAREFRKELTDEVEIGDNSASFIMGEDCEEGEDKFSIFLQKVQSPPPQELSFDQQ